MKRLVLSLVILAVGCKEKVARVAPSADPRFDEEWSSLEKSGAEPVFIEGELHGGGLLGEVRRAVDPSPDSSLLKRAPLPGLLPDAEVVRVIRQNLPGVKGCYQVEERAGTVSSGKAIVTLEIDGSSGAVTNVKVDAPAFSSSGLPACVTGRARSWAFPRFTAKEHKRFSYPFVFVGG